MRRCFLFHPKMHTWNLSLLVLGLSLPCMLSLSLAQAPPITSSGLNTQVSEPIVVGGQTQYDITGGTRPGGGANLFHSFGDFGVPSDNIANFQNTLVNGAFPHTDNILARVTGGDMSNIFGSIKTADFGSANLFLMNPAGFLFGPNATVNVGGMVAFSSADYLKLTDNVRFNAIPNAATDALLTAMPVASFGFSELNPGAITVKGSQFIAESISLVGGNITIESGTPEGGTAHRAQFSAPNGNILLASATSPGEFDAATLQPLPNVNDTSFSSFGSVFLAPESSINVRGTSTVSIRGGQFVLSVNDATLTTAESPSVTNTFSLNSGSSIVSSNSDANRGADIKVVAGVLQMDGAMIQNNTSGLDGGAGGNIFMNADTITLQNGSSISSSTSGAGDSGTVHLNANESISLVNSSIASNSETPPGTPIVGNGGQLNLSAPSITLEQGSALLARTTGAGHAGAIELNADTLSLADMSVVQTSTSSSGPADSITVQGLKGSGDTAHTVSLVGGSSLSSNSVGNDEGEGGAAGNILVETHTLSLSEGSQITTSSISSPGDAGTITINAGEEVQLSQGILTSRSESNISDEFVNDFVIGNAGSITVSAPTVMLKNNSRIASTTDSRYTGDPSKGNAGSVTVNATNLSLTEGSQLTSSSIIGDSGQSPVGNAGNVTIQVLASLASSVLTNGAGSGLFTDTQGTGAGGNITLNANTVTLQNGGTLSAKTSGPATTATGGSITVNATDHVIMTSGASITASSTGPGNAGNISIDAGQNFVATNSSVTTQANLASGGAIKITTTPSGMVDLTNSTISASVRDGAGGGGSVNIDPQFVILQNSEILAQAVQGPGGNISITTNLLLQDATSNISASSQFGVNGTVTIQSPNAPASGKIQPLRNTPLEATSLLNQRCAALAGGEFSSFTVAGRDSLPTEPNSWLASPLIAFGAGEELGVRGAGLESMTLGASVVGESTVLSLRQIAPTGFLTQAFAIDWSAGCES